MGRKVWIQTGAAIIAFAILIQADGEKPFASSQNVSRSALAVALPSPSTRIGNRSVPVTKAIFDVGPSIAAPAPQDLNGEHFLTDKIGYAITGNGDILKSTDGGELWRSVAHAPSSTFSSLSWQGSVGVASGLVSTMGEYSYVPTLGITADNGRRWEFVHPKLPNVVLSTNTAYSLEVHPLSKKCMVVLPPPAVQMDVSFPLEVSTDGGETFHPIELPEGWNVTGGFAALSSNSMALTMTNNKTGESAVAVVSTRTSSVRLIKKRLPVELYALDMAPSGVLYAAGGTFDKYAQPVADAIYSVSLKKNAFAPISEIPRKTGTLYNPFIQIDVRRRGVIYALEGGLVQGQNGPSRGNLIVTYDDGRHWRTTSGTGSTITVHHRSLWLLSGPSSWNFPVAPIKDFYSSNGGRGFSMLPWNRNGVKATWAQMGSSQQIYVGTNAGIDTVSTKGEWARSSLPAATTVSAVSYAGLGHRTQIKWWSTLSNTLVEVSSDGGRHWRSLSLPQADLTIDGVSAYSNGRIAISGHPAMSEFDSLYITRDFGGKWTTVHQPFGQRYGMSIDFATKTLGYATYGVPVGDETISTPFLYLTTDGGVHWRPVSLGTWTWLSSADLSSFNDTVVFAGLSGNVAPKGVGSNTLSGSDAILIFYPPNGAGTRAYNLGRHFPTSVSFANRLDGVMTTMDGRLYVTTDGGARWRLVSVQSMAKSKQI